MSFPVPRPRTLLSLTIGGLVGFAVLQMAVQVRATFGDGDMTFALCAGRALLRGIDPYGPACMLLDPTGNRWATYPLTTAMFASLFVWLGDLAAPFLFALSSGLLAFAIVREGPLWRLLLFFSAVYFEDLRWFQWAPFMAAIYLLPDLLPLALVKPQFAVPLLSKLNRGRLLGLCAFAALSLIIDPQWPWEFWETTRTYDGFIPLLTLPFGPLLALALLNWRNESARLLLLLALMPQRGYYDMLLVFLVAETPAQMGILVVASWVFYFFHPLPHSDSLGMYLCATAMAMPWRALAQMKVHALRAVREEK